MGFRSGHLITDHEVQFRAGAFAGWCRRRGVQLRFGAIGEYGSLAVSVRFIRSRSDECTRAILVPFRRAGDDGDAGLRATPGLADALELRGLARAREGNPVAAVPAIEAWARAYPSSETANPPMTT